MLYKLISLQRKQMLVCADERKRFSLDNSESQIPFQCEVSFDPVRMLRFLVQVFEVGQGILELF